MTPYISSALSAAELRGQITADLASLRADPPSMTIWNERLHLGALLRAIAELPLLEYPLSIAHTSDCNPDFLLTSGSSPIGIEMSRIAQPAKVEYDTSDAVKNMVSSPSPFLVAYSKKEKGAVVDAAFPLNASWNKLEDEDQFWWSCAHAIIDKKTAIRQRADFRDTGKNWLVLKDELSIYEGSFEVRAKYLEYRLRGYWPMPTGFDLIALVNEEYREFALLTPTGIQMASS